MDLKRMIACISAAVLAQGFCVVPKTFADDTVVVDDPGRFRYVPSSALVSRSTPASSDELVHNSRFDDGYIMTEGIDVSKYQPEVDWETLAEDNVDFVIIRIGFRGFGESGALVVDNYYASHIEGAKKAGLDVGLYFFTQAVTPEEAVEEANFVLETLDGTELEAPIYLDVEAISADGRMESANLTPEQMTENIDAFCSTIEEAGYDAGIYANIYWLEEKMNVEELEPYYSIWLANYTDQTLYEGEYNMWQYTNVGSVAGIDGYVDKNVFYSREVEFAEETVLLRTLSPMIPEHVGDGQITYTSSDESIALVNEDGCVTPLKDGTVTITAESDNGSMDSVEVTIDVVPHLTLNQSMLMFTEIGEGSQLNVYGTENVIYWMSSNEDVVTVTANGYVEAVGYGTAYITAMDIFGNKSTCSVMVTEQEVKVGDCNADGCIDAVDATVVLSYAATHGANTTSYIPEPILRIYDANLDSAVDALDASAILFLSAFSGSSSIK